MKKRFKKLVACITIPVLAVQAGLYAIPSLAAEDANKQTMLQFYENWKERYVVQDTYVQEEKPQYYVYYAEEHYAGDNISVPVTVSEAHGYGMLITACMAEYDAEAKALFDGMYRYYQAHLSDIGPHLMSWQQCDNGTALIDGAKIE